MKVRLTIKRLPTTDEWKVTVCINGKYDEDKAYYTNDKYDAKLTMKSMADEYQKDGYTVEQ